VCRQIEQSWGGKSRWRQEALAWGSRVLQAEASEQLAIVDAGGREPPRSNSGQREQTQEDPDDDGFHDAAGEVQQASAGKGRRNRNYTQSGEGSEVGAQSPRISFNVYDVSIPFEDFCMAFTEPHEGDGVFNIRYAHALCTLYEVLSSASLVGVVTRCHACPTDLLSTRT
jgi:hypothetical protein